MFSRTTRLSMLIALLAGCASSDRQDEVISALTRADEPLLVTRPALVAGKYALMASDTYSYYRGTLAVFRHDWESGHLSKSRFDLGDPVWGVGDPHPENFGLLVAGDGTAALETNDLDSCDRVPALFDLRRLVAGMALVSKLSNPQASAHDVAGAAAQGYAAELERLANGGAPQRYDNDRGEVVLHDLFKRSARDLAAHAELAGLTDGHRRFLRGVIDPADPTGVQADLPVWLRASLETLVSRFGTRVLDVVHEYGSGVASWPRVRLLVLLAGPADDGSDDFIVEVKEEGASALDGWYAPDVAVTDAAQRVESGARRAWFRPDADPRYFTGTWQGFPVQVRTEAEANKGVKVKRFVDDRATQQAMNAIAADLGALLARIHSATGPGTAARLHAAIDDSAAFVSEQAAFGDSCSDETLADFAAFGRELTARGPLLGYPATPPQVSSSLAPLFEAP
ncbi:MAG: DUF2252 family protein [Myxococcaceae bacterium]